MYIGFFIFLYMQITKLLYIYIIPIINRKTIITSISQTKP